jgi:F-type H+-transporting ATPase subunit a
MEKLHHSLWIVQVVNDLFGPFVAALLRPLGWQFAPGQQVIPDYLVMCALVVAVLAGIGLLVRSSLSVERPSRLQIVLEDIVTFFVDLLKNNVGETGTRYLPVVATLGLFIFVANLLGKVPGLMSPTANVNVPLGCALTAWVYYQWQGIRVQGLIGHLKHFALPPGAPVFIAPLMFPIEVISHLSRMMSLTIRLFGNVFGEEMVVLILASLIPFLVPLPMMVLGLVTGSLQAFIFVMLTTIYLAGVVHTEHDHGHDEAHGHEAHGHAAARAAA